MSYVDAHAASGDLAGAEDALATAWTINAALLDSPWLAPHSEWVRHVRWQLHGIRRLPHPANGWLDRLETVDPVGAWLDTAANTAISHIAMGNLPGGIPCNTSRSILDGGPSFTWTRMWEMLQSLPMRSELYGRKRAADMADGIANVLCIVPRGKRWSPRSAAAAMELLGTGRETNALWNDDGPHPGGFASAWQLNRERELTMLVLQARIALTSSASVVEGPATQLGSWPWAAEWDVRVRPDGCLVISRDDELHLLAEVVSGFVACPLIGEGIRSGREGELRTAPFRRE
jgi:hypothetical protein